MITTDMLDELSINLTMSLSKIFFIENTIKHLLIFFILGLLFSPIEDAMRTMQGDTQLPNEMVSMLGFLATALAIGSFQFSYDRIDLSRRSERYAAYLVTSTLIFSMVFYSLLLAGPWP